MYFQDSSIVPGIELLNQPDSSHIHKPHIPRINISKTAFTQPSFISDPPELWPSVLIANGPDSSVAITRVPKVA